MPRVIRGRGPYTCVLEEGEKTTLNELKEVNLRTNDDDRPLFMSTLLTPKEEKYYVNLLTKYEGVFVWSYKEMLELDPKVAIHHLVVKHGTRAI